MTVFTVLLLFCAGLAGGAANAIAGGATLITFPALLAAGLAPIPANATNAFAVVFGNLLGAFTERKKLPAPNRDFWTMCILALLGGGAGAFLLLRTPEKFFMVLVPALIGGATIIFALAKPIQRSLTGLLSAGRKQLLRNALVAPATVYGGYFGAGLGVILMAVLSATHTAHDPQNSLRENNAIKNFLSVLTNVAAISIFVWQGTIQWPQAGVMMLGCIAGGFAGARLLAVLEAQTIRKAIIVIGCAMTLIYAWRYWF